jgi:hypothetical protein
LFLRLVGLLRQLFELCGYGGPDRYRWRFATDHATVGDMTMRDLLSLVAVVVGMLLVLAAA